MYYIDVHSHIYPDAISKKATESTCRFYDVGTEHIGTSSELLRLDREVGIVRSVLLPVSVNPVHTESINNFTLRECAEHPEFIPFATMHAGNTDIAAMASRFAEQGFKGVKLHPDMQGFNADDARLFPLYDIIAGKLPLMLHSGDPRYNFSHPERIRRILHEFPKLTVIAAHMGGWSMQDTALEFLRGEERCFTDTSSALSSLSVEKAMKLINAYGIDRVMFGSDYPIEDPAYNRDLVERLPLSDGQREKIAHVNVENLLGLQISEHLCSRTEF